MKILKVCTHFPLSDKVLRHCFIFDEAHRLVKKGIEVHVADLESSIDKEIQGIKVHGKAHAKVISLFSPSLLLHALKTLHMYPPSWYLHPKRLIKMADRSFFIAQLVEKYKIDLINADFAFPGGFAAYLAKKIEKPLIVSIYGYDVQSHKATKYGALSRNFTRDAVTQTLRKADAIIVHAQSHFDTVLQIIGEHRKDKIFFIHMDVDADRFNPSIDKNEGRKKYEIDSSQTVVLFARHLRSIYGPEYLIRAAFEVIKKHPETIFLMVGDGPLRDYLQKLVRRLELKRNVIFVGYVPRKKMPFYYAACDIFCDPCVFGQGKSTLEALACGKPVVGFKIGQIRIRNGLDGFLVKPKNEEAFADKISFLIENPDIRTEMGLRGRRLVEAKHDAKKIDDVLIQIYNRLLEMKMM